MFEHIRFERRKRTHIAITQLGINLDVLNRSTLVDMYVICEDHGNMRKLRWAQHLEMLLLTCMPNVMIWKAHPVFDELPSHDLASWNWICMPNVVK